MNNTSIGLMVDKVKEVIEVSKDRVEQTIIDVGEAGEFIEGLAKIEGCFIMVVDLNRLLEQGHN